MEKNTKHPSPGRARQEGLRAIRFRFEYDRTGVRLLQARPYLKLLPPSDKPATNQGQSGCWLELHDGEGVLLYRRVLSSPFRFDLELHGDKPGASLRRLPWPDAQGKFTAWAPDLAAAQVLLLYSSPLRANAAGQKAVVQLKAVRDEKTGTWRGKKP